MAKARLHWFWRGMLAAMFGTACFTGCVYYTRIYWDPCYSIQYLFAAWGLSIPIGEFLEPMAWGLPPALGALLAYGLLTRWFGNRPLDGELHCRRCNHILRGLGEPRCPECGEAI